MRALKSAACGAPQEEKGGLNTSFWTSFSPPVAHHVLAAHSRRPRRVVGREQAEAGDSVERALRLDEGEGDVSLFVEPV